jgi:ABC-2 type transport system ATP-binding protein
MMIKGLSVEGLIKGFPGFKLGPLDLRAEPGVVYGLLGPNGAGKTTLLNCLAGQSRADQGEIRWERTLITRDRWRHREEIAYIPEKQALYDEATVQQTLSFYSRFFAQWDPSFVSEWLRRFSLDPGKRVGALSKGMKVKLSLILGLARKARLLLLDEPTAGLDPDSRLEIQELLRCLRSNSTCILISSHLFDDLEKVATEMLFIREGRFVFQISHEAVRKLRLVTFSGHPTECAYPAEAALFQWSANGATCFICPEEHALAMQAASSSPVPVREVGLNDVYFALRKRGSQ